MDELYGIIVGVILAYTAVVGWLVRTEMRARSNTRRLDDYGELLKAQDAEIKELRNELQQEFRLAVTELREEMREMNTSITTLNKEVGKVLGAVQGLK